jgi:tetratricopeptide (TPR) repeat protein
MNSKKATLSAMLTLSILLGGRAALADTTAWSRANAAANEARQRGDYAQAETLYKEAIDLQVAKLGADNPEVAVSLNNLAVLYQDQSLYPKAEQAYLQALGILEKNQLQSRTPLCAGAGNLGERREKRTRQRSHDCRGPGADLSFPESK